MAKKKQKLVLNFSFEFQPHDNTFDDEKNPEACYRRELKDISKDILDYLKRTNVSYKWYALQITKVKQLKTTK